MKTRKCKFCDTQIFWARNVATGKLVPLEADSNASVVRFEVIDELGRQDEQEVRCEVRACRGYRTHFETCPGADKARKR